MQRNENCSALAIHNGAALVEGRPVIPCAGLHHTHTLCLQRRLHRFRKLEHDIALVNAGSPARSSILNPPCAGSSTTTPRLTFLGCGGSCGAAAGVCAGDEGGACCCPACRAPCTVNAELSARSAREKAPGKICVARFREYQILPVRRSLALHGVGGLVIQPLCWCVRATPLDPDTSNPAEPATLIGLRGLID